MKKNQCPDQLQKLIDRVNLVSIDLELPDIEFSRYVYTPIGDVPKLESYPSTDISILPSKLVEYLESEAKIFVSEFPQASESRKELIKESVIAASYKEFRKLHGDFKQLVRASVKYDAREWGFHISLSAFAYIDQYGIINIQPDELLATISGVNCGRIRLCGFCRKVFWAKRINGKRSEGKACSKRCSDNLGARKDRLNKTISKLINEYDEEKRILKNLKSKLSSGNNLIKEREDRIRKIKNKIEKAKLKEERSNGNI